jgi:O-antigen ligase
LAPSLGMKAVLAAPAVAIPVGWWSLLRPGRWLALFFAAALLLPPLPIPMGDSGPHPCLIFAALGLWLGIARASEWHIPRSGVGAALFALFTVMLLSVGSAAIHSGAAAAASSLARVALFGIPVYVFFYTASAPRSGEPGLRWIYWCAAGSALFACVDFYYQFPAPAGYGPQFVWMDSGVFRRAQGFFYEASTLGNFCVFFLVMIAVALAGPRQESPVSRKWLLAGGAVFFAALVLSYSRASVASLLVALAMLGWLNRKRLRFARLAGLLAALGAGGALLTWQIFPRFAETYWMRLSATGQYLFTATEGLLSGRVASWRTLSAWIAEHPWQALAGIGYKTLPYTDYLGAPVVADNMYLSLLVETGIAGLAALLWLNLAVLRASARAARSSDREQAFFGAWMLCFWAGEAVQMASGDLLTYWRVLPLYLGAMARAIRP